MKTDNTIISASGKIMIRKLHSSKDVNPEFEYSPDEDNIFIGHVVIAFATMILNTKKKKL